MFKGSLIELSKILNLYSVSPVEWYAVQENKPVRVLLHSAVRDWLEAYRARLIEAFHKRNWDVIAQMISEADLTIGKMTLDERAVESRARFLHQTLQY